MNAHDRQEFCYFEHRSGALGLFFFLMGTFIVGLMLGHVLGLVHVKFEGSPMDEIPLG
jgi:hypothetical protein